MNVPLMHAFLKKKRVFLFTMKSGQWVMDFK